MIAAKKTHEQESIDWLLIFVDNIVKGDDRYKEYVIPVLIEAKQLINGEKNYYNISRSSFHQIVHLKNKCEQLMNVINVNDPTSIDWLELQEDLNKNPYWI